jgi:predicted O-methyltransferase YrrM
VQVRRRARDVATAAVRRAARRVGLDVVPTGIYSPIPAVPPPADPIWSRQYAFELDTAAQMGFVEQELAPHLQELPDGLAAAERHGFQIWNGQYQAGDAEVLYAVLRRLRPRRVLELGSGFSTLVSAAACARNAAEGDPVELVAVDPAPRTAVPAAMDGLARLERRDCRELPLERFLELDAGDVLFIDTSHVVKLGSELNRLVLEVLPRLASGVHVHFHDVFLPYEYPRYLLELEAYFNEQYLVHAFLIGNPEWEVWLSLCALYRHERERLAALVPSLGDPPVEARRAGVVPAAFWLRRRPGAGASAAGDLASAG